jgi:hypothetical protein
MSNWINYIRDPGRFLNIPQEETHLFQNFALVAPLPPQQKSFTINFKLAICDSFSAEAAVCQNSEGLIIKAVSAISTPFDPNTGEALATLLFANLVASLHLKNYVIEGGSLVVILTLSPPSPPIGFLIYPGFLFLGSQAN